MRSIKSRRKRYEACDDVVPVVGLDLPCAAGRLGLQSAPSALLRALGFEPRRQEISNTPGGGVAYLVPVVGLDLPCAAGRLGLQSAPSALLRALGFEPQRQEISNTPGWGRCLFGPSGDTAFFKKHSNINGFRTPEQRNYLYSALLKPSISAAIARFISR